MSTEAWLKRCFDVSKLVLSAGQCLYGSLVANMSSGGTPNFKPCISSLGSKITPTPLSPPRRIEAFQRSTWRLCSISNGSICPEVLTVHQLQYDQAVSYPVHQRFLIPLAPVEVSVSKLLQRNSTHDSAPNTRAVLYSVHLLYNCLKKTEQTCLTNALLYTGMRVLVTKGHNQCQGSFVMYLPSYL